MRGDLSSELMLQELSTGLMEAQSDISRGVQETAKIDESLTRQISRRVASGTA